MGIGAGPGMGITAPLFYQEISDMDENIITFNVTNWITVVLMAAIGFALLGGLQNWWMKKHPTAA